MREAALRDGGSLLLDLLGSRGKRPCELLAKSSHEMLTSSVWIIEKGEWQAVRPHI